MNPRAGSGPAKPSSTQVQVALLRESPPLVLPGMLCILTVTKLISWILPVLSFITLGGMGIWAHNEKYRLRRLLLGHRVLISESELLKLFDRDGVYSKKWLLLVMGELAQSLSLDMGAMRPTDRLDRELAPIDGFEGLDRLDWLPVDVRSKLNDSMVLQDIIEIIWTAKIGANEMTK